MTAMMILILLVATALLEVGALPISPDVRMEVNCTGVSFPQWRINGIASGAYSESAMTELGIDVIPAIAIEAFNEDGSAFQTIVIIGSVQVHGLTIQCVAGGAEIFPTTELEFLEEIPQPENLTVAGNGFVQWDPPYSSHETADINYVICDMVYTVKVIDTQTGTERMPTFTDIEETVFTFQPPPDCIGYTVSVRANCGTSEGESAIVPVAATGDYETPEQVDQDQVEATAHGSFLTVVVTPPELSCNSPTDYIITYNGEQYDMPATGDRMELNVGKTDTCSCDITARNSAGDSDSTEVAIRECGDEKTIAKNINEQNVPSYALIAGVVAAAVVILLIVFIGIGVILVVRKRQGKNKVENRTENVYVEHTHDQSEVDAPTSYSRSSSDGSSESSINGSPTLSQDTRTTIDGDDTDPTTPSPHAVLSNQGSSGTTFVLVEPDKEKYATVAVQQQKTKCSPPPLDNERVIYSDVQQAKQNPSQTYAEVTVQKPTCSPPSSGSADRVIYSDVQPQLQGEQV